MRSVLASTGSTVLVLVVALVVLGIAMVVLAVWLVRSTRGDHPSLGPLEVMGDRSFRRGDEQRRAGKLSAARTADAPPPAPIVPIEDVAEERVAGEQPVDEPEEAASEPEAEVGVEVEEAR